MNFKKYIITVLSVILIMTLFVGCRNTGDQMSSANSLDNTSSTYGVVDVIEQESNNVASSDNNVSSEEENTADVSSNSSEEIIDNNYVSVGDGGNPENNNSEDDLPPTYIVSTPSTLTPGDNKPVSSANNPFVTSPNYKGKVVTVDIKAGTSEFYKLDRVANKVLTINSPSAFVVYDGVKYTPKNGVLSFNVETNLLASDQILFEIGNSGSKTESFTILFSSPIGSRDNPKTLNVIGEKLTATIKKGNDQGYFYSYKATQDGKIRFYILSDAKKGKLTIDKLIDPKNFIIQQRNTTDTEEDYLKTDNIGTYVEFDVKKSDEFVIGAASTVSVDTSINIDWKAVYA